MKLKADVLEKIINGSIDSVRLGRWESEQFAIHDDGNIQVQVLVTSNEMDFIDELLKDYVYAK